MPRSKRLADKAIFEDSFGGPDQFTCVHLKLIMDFSANPSNCSMGTIHCVVLGVDDDRKKDGR